MKPDTTARARELRRSSTDAERAFWRLLRDWRFEGYKFRRQHPSVPFIVDFVCLETSLVMGLDGGQHAERAGADIERTAFLESQGFKVMRFWNNEVTSNRQGVLEVVLEELQKGHATLGRPLTRLVSLATLSPLRGARG